MFFCPVATIIYLYYSGITDIKEVLTELHPVQAQWKAIMKYLKVPDCEVESIEQDKFYKCQKCMRAGISYWLYWNTERFEEAPKVNWQSILAALRDPKVGKGELADNIEGKFKQNIREKM